MLHLTIPALLSGIANVMKIKRLKGVCRTGRQPFLPAQGSSGIPKIQFQLDVPLSAGKQVPTAYLRTFISMNDMLEMTEEPGQFGLTWLVHRMKKEFAF